MQRKEAVLFQSMFMCAQTEHTHAQAAAINSITESVKRQTGTQKILFLLLHQRFPLSDAAVARSLIHLLN